MSIFGVCMAGFIAMNGATVVGALIAGASFIGLLRSLIKTLIDKNA